MGRDAAFVSLPVSMFGYKIGAPAIWQVRQCFLWIRICRLVQHIRIGCVVAYALVGLHCLQIASETLRIVDVMEGHRHSRTTGAERCNRTEVVSLCLASAPALRVFKLHRGRECTKEGAVLIFNVLFAVSVLLIYVDNKILVEVNSNLSCAAYLAALSQDQKEPQKKEGGCNDDQRGVQGIVDLAADIA